MVLHLDGIIADSQPVVGGLEAGEVFHGGWNWKAAVSIGRGTCWSRGGYFSINHGGPLCPPS